jgi:hypothetical protein
MHVTLKYTSRIHNIHSRCLNIHFIRCITCWLSTNIRHDIYCQLIYFTWTKLLSLNKSICHVLLIYITDNYNFQTGQIGCPQGYTLTTTIKSRRLPTTYVLEEASTTIITTVTITSNAKYPSIPITFTIFTT